MAGAIHGSGSCPSLCLGCIFTFDSFKGVIYMKASPITLKSVLMINAVLLGLLLLLKPLFTAPAQAQQVRPLGLPGTYQVSTAGTSFVVIDTRNGTVKLISSVKPIIAHWETNYKEVSQSEK